MSLTKYLSALPLTAANSTVRATAASAADCDIDVDNGQFVSADGTDTDLLANLVAALEASAGGTWQARIVAAVVGIRCTTHAWSIEFGHANTTFDKALLGFSAATISASSGAWVDAAYHHKHGWYSTQFIESDTGVQDVNNVTQTTSPGRQTTTVKHGLTGTTRYTTHAFEPLYKALPTTGYENHDFKSFHATCADGSFVRHYPDVAVTAAYEEYATDNGYYGCVLDVATLESFRPQRQSSSVALYSWPVGMIGA
jgi:hypothetical protein